MKFAFWTGCVAKQGAPELYQSTVASLGVLGIEVEELVGGACTGAGVLTERNPRLADALNARTFAMAEQMGLPIMTICSTCTGTMYASHERLKDEAYRAEINEILAPEGLQYNGTTEIYHLMWILVEKIGLEKLRSYVKVPLGGLNVAPFYGCYILRPSRLMDPQHHDRDTYLEQIIVALGANAVDYSGATKCCGFPLTTMNRVSALKMTGTHIAEAKDKGADLLVTPCPLCHLNLDGQQVDAAKVMGRSLDVPILHLPQLLGIAFGLDAKDLGLHRNLISPRRIFERARRMAVTSS
ncbi:MAG: CoB--CoM heterodisulfide reductase iron-sulfur subunit B family protein [Bacillota bacterium]|nr:CoB--CoM heterodisulfide reductase iron-sulfur subunit B family protein [Bacillota bacterium]